jgi:uncharacterized protein YhjY with autotransporter beta-barrel domain
VGQRNQQRQTPEQERRACHACPVAPRSIAALPSSQTTGARFGASLETGYPFSIGGGVKLEPQLQLAFHLNATNDLATQIQFSDVQSLTGRAGLRIMRA